METLVKLAVVGGGSTYTPELVDGMARLRDQLPLEELVLVDPDPHRLELVGGISRRIMAAQGHPATVSLTSDLDAGIDSADAVVLQLRVGGQAARHKDESWPLECGCVGQETTGAGGLAKALRTVPVVLDVAERARKHAAPGAWVVDFTNPVGIVTRALLDAGYRAMGLCNVAIGLQRYFAQLLGVEPGAVQLDHVGLNHLTWERAVTVNGVDVLPQLLADHGDEIADHIELPPAVVRQLGVVPSYYLRYYYAHDAVVDESRGRPTRAQVVAGVEQELLDIYADPTVATKPDLLAQRGGAYYSEAAVNLLASLVGDTRDVQVVNVRNAGTLPFLSDDAVIEVPAIVGVRGATPLSVAPVDPLFAGLISHVTAYEELAVDAAVRGGRERIFKALLAHPLVGQVDPANALTDRLLAANHEYLPWAGAGTRR
jgi:6-phospho-beta-glucosidase